MFLRTLRKLFALFGKKSPSAKTISCCLFLEVLEDRAVPSTSGQLVWTGPSGGSWSSSANWTDPVSGLHFTPSSTDQLLFGDGGAGANTDSTMDYTSLTVDRVIMDSTYTHTLTMSSGHTLTTTNYVIQYGSLSMTGTATVSAGDYIDINGAVTGTSITSPGGLDASGDFFLYSAGSITAHGTIGMAVTSANFSDSGTITVGTSTTPSALAISGPFTQSAGTITVNAGSTLTFDSLADPSAYPVLEATVNMMGSDAEIDTDTQLAISGGTLTAKGADHDIIGGTGGDVRIYNSGTVDVGVSGTSTATLELDTGSLTVGALDPDGTATGGTVNVYVAATLSMPAAATTSSFDVTALGVVNMYGGTIDMDTTRVGSLDIHAASSGLAAGQLNSNGGSLMGMTIDDTIDGSVQNDGVISFGGAALHTLDVSDDFTQDSSGTLDMRLDNSEKNDKLTVGGTATLDGTLSLTGLHSLSSFQTWTIMTYGASSGDFDTVDFPDTNLRWVAGPPGLTDYKVSN
jgi:hypothetical protein